MIEDPLAAARARIRAAYDPDHFRTCGRELVETLTEHWRNIFAGQGPVLNWAPPRVNLPAAAATLQPSGTVEADPQVRFRELLQTALGRGHNLHHPHYIGHQVPAPVPVAGLFDALAGMTNQVMAIYEMAPWGAAIEHALVHAWGTQLGLAPGFSGFITHGGSLANLTALLTARNCALATCWQEGLTAFPQPPVLVTHAAAHYGIMRSAGVLGLGTNQVIPVGFDARQRMDPQQLDRSLADLRQRNVPVIAVCACACATAIGSFDALEEIADVCEKHGVWLHVDAAHGGGAAFSTEHRHLLRGIERADSVICDAHKMLFAPALCAFVFYKRGADKLATFQQQAPYLFNAEEAEVADCDVGRFTIECTKRAAAFGLWGLWATYGPQLLGDLVDVAFATTRRLHALLQTADDFEPLHEPQANILVFRYVADRRLELDQLGRLNREIRRRLVASGEFYIVQTEFAGATALRTSVMNPLTNTDHLDELLASIRRTARRIIDE